MIAKKLTFSIVMKFLQQGIGYISLFFVSRLMGPEALGIVAFGLSYVAMFGAFGIPGIGAAHLKRVSEGNDFATCNGVYFTLKTLSVMLVGLLIIGSIFYSKYIKGEAFISPIHEKVVYVSLIVYLVDQFSLMFINTFTARKEVAKIDIGRVLGKSIAVIWKVIVAFTGLGIVYLAVGNLLNSIVILLFCLYFFRNYPVAKPNKKLFVSYLKFALAIMFISFLETYLRNLDKVMIQFFANSTHVGYYTGAKSISLLLSSITVATIGLLYPTISYYCSKKKFEEVKILSLKAERYLTMVVLPICVLMSIYAKQIVTIILGAKFVDNTPAILIPLSFLVYTQSTVISFKYQIVGVDKMRLALVLSGIMLILNIIFNVIFIPSEWMGVKLLGWGAQGAAYATLISSILGSLMFRYYSWKISGVFGNKVVVKHFIAALLMTVTLLILNRYIPGKYFLDMIIGSVIGTLIYLSILWVFKEIDKNEVKFFLDLINPKSLHSYAKEELKEGYIEKYKD